MVLGSVINPCINTTRRSHQRMSCIVSVVKHINPKDKIEILQELKVAVELKHNYPLSRHVTSLYFKTREIIWQQLGLQQLMSYLHWMKRGGDGGLLNCIKGKMLMNSFESSWAAEKITPSQGEMGKRSKCWRVDCSHSPLNQSSYLVKLKWWVASCGVCWESACVVLGLCWGRCLLLAGKVGGWGDHLHSWRGRTGHNSSAEALEQKKTL